MDLSRPPRPGAATEPPMRHCEAIRTKTRAATPPWRRNQGSVEKHRGPRVGWCIRWGSLPDGYIRRTEPHRHCRQARNTLQAAAGGSRGPRTRVSRGLRPRPPPRAPNAGNHSIQSVGYVAGSNAHKSRGHGNPVSANHPFFWPRGHIRKPGGGSTEPGRVGWGVQCFTRNVAKPHAFPLGAHSRLDMLALEQFVSRSTAWKCGCTVARSITASTSEHRSCAFTQQASLFELGDTTHTSTALCKLYRIEYIRAPPEVADTDLKGPRNSAPHVSWRWPSLPGHTPPPWQLLSPSSDRTNSRLLRKPQSLPSYYVRWLT